MLRLKHKIIISLPVCATSRRHGCDRLIPWQLPWRHRHARTVATLDQALARPALTARKPPRHPTRYRSTDRSRSAWMRPGSPYPPVATDAETIEVYHFLVQDNMSLTGDTPSRYLTTRQDPGRGRNHALGGRPSAIRSHNSPGDPRRTKPRSASDAQNRVIAE